MTKLGEGPPKSKRVKTTQEDAVGSVPHTSQTLIKPVANKPTTLADHRVKHCVCVLYSPKLRKPFILESRDVARLQDKEWISETVVEFLMYYWANEYLESRYGLPDELYVVGPYVWAKWLESGCKTFAPEPTEFHNAKIPEYPYIAIALNVNDSHWILSIIANANSTLEGTSIMLFDSLLATHPEAEKQIHKLIYHFTKLGLGWNYSRKQSQAVPVHYPKVIRQPDYYNCGFYPAHFMKVFMSDPARYLDHCTGKCPIQGDVEDIWRAGELSEPRKDIINRINLLAKYKQRAAYQTTGRAIPEACF